MRIQSWAIKSLVSTQEDMQGANKKLKRNKTMSVCSLLVCRWKLDS